MVVSYPFTKVRQTSFPKQDKVSGSLHTNSVSIFCLLADSIYWLFSHIIGADLWIYAFKVQLCYTQMSSVFITFWHAFIFHFMSIFIFFSPLLTVKFIKDAHWIFRISLAPSILPCTGTIRKELWVKNFPTLIFNKHEKCARLYSVPCALLSSKFWKSKAGLL